MFLLAQQGLLVQWITGHVETVFTYLSLHWFDGLEIISEIKGLYHISQQLDLWLEKVKG